MKPCNYVSTFKKSNLHTKPKGKQWMRIQVLENWVMKTLRHWRRLSSGTELSKLESCIKNLEEEAQAPLQLRWTHTPSTISWGGDGAAEYTYHRLEPRRRITDDNC